MTLSARGRQIAVLETLGETGFRVCMCFDGARIVLHRNDIHIH